MDAFKNYVLAPTVIILAAIGLVAFAFGILLARAGMNIGRRIPRLLWITLFAPFALGAELLSPRPRLGQWELTVVAMCALVEAVLVPLVVANKYYLF